MGEESFESFEMGRGDDERGKRQKILNTTYLSRDSEKITDRVN